MIVTTTMVREIRRRRAEGETLNAIAADLGIHPHTVWKYASDRNTAAVVAAEKRHWARAKADPERMERRRDALRRYEARNPNRRK